MLSDDLADDECGLLIDTISVHARPPPTSQHPSRATIPPTLCARESSMTLGSTGRGSSHASPQPSEFDPHPVGVEDQRIAGGVVGLRRRGFHGVVLHVERHAVEQRLERFVDSFTVIRGEFARGPPLAHKFHAGHLAIGVGLQESEQFRCPGVVGNLGGFVPHCCSETSRLYVPLRAGQILRQWGRAAPFEVHV
ncbi:hypothetical protein [Nocardia sp. NPDC005745]|uniref:hypothetical protein n=1 Tax=Nocardia sp. NPDC005745 TaxID=3157061 RepID=UPI0033FB2169